VKPASQALFDAMARFSPSSAAEAQIADEGPADRAA